MEQHTKIIFITLWHFLNGVMLKIYTALILLQYLNMKQKGDVNIHPYVPPLTWTTYMHFMPWVPKWMWLQGEYQMEPSPFSSKHS